MMNACAVQPIPADVLPRLPSVDDLAVDGPATILSRPSSSRISTSPSSSFRSLPPSSSSSSLCSFVPPWSNQQDRWLRWSSPDGLRVQTAAQWTYHFVVTLVSAWAIAELHTQDSDLQLQSTDSDPLSPATTTTLLTAMLAVLLAHSAIVGVLVLVRARRPSLWSYHRWWSATHHVLHTASTAAALAGGTALLCLPAEDGSAVVALEMALWALVAVELAGSGASFALYAYLHLVFPHSAISALPPFAPLWAEYREEEHLGGRHVTPNRVGLGISAEELKAVAPLRYHRAMRCDGLCAICVADMEEGDSMRLFTCGHGFHAGCVDRWLVVRRVCPLCVCRVRLPKPKVVVVAGGDEVELARTGVVSNLSVLGSR